MIYEQQPDEGYRRLYYSLQKLVDQAIGRILDALDSSGMADDTIVVFTSDHGDMLGAHGGMQQKWCNAYDESVRVPMIVKGPGVATKDGGIATPTSHVDLIPTLMGLAGIDVERAAAGVAEHHDEAQALPGRDLSGLIVGSATPESVASPLYFMTEDDISRGLSTTEHPHRRAVSPGRRPVLHRIDDRDAPDRSGRHRRVVEAQPLLRTARRLERSTRHPQEPVRASRRGPGLRAAQPHHRPEERRNRVDDAHETLHQMQAVLDAQRDAKRNLPRLRNPVG